MVREQRVVRAACVVGAAQRACVFERLGVDVIKRVDPLAPLVALSADVEEAEADALMGRCQD